MRPVSFIAFMMLLAGCLKAPLPQAQHADGTYFPVRNFLLDQYRLYQGQPYPMYRIVTFNGKSDTAYTNLLNLDFPAIAAPFFAGDISDTTFIGQYDAAEFQDGVTGNHTIQYTAKSPKLYNQTTQVSLDAENNHVSFLYLKNVKNGRFSTHVQNLTYVPHKYLQILDDERAKMGGARSLKVEYRFLQSSNDEGTIQ